MKREELRKLLGDSASDEVIDQIMSLHGKDVEGHKSSLSTAQTELDNLRRQLEEANKQIQSFKGMDIEGVKRSADEWKTKFEEAQRTASEQLAQVRFDHALEIALANAKAKNVKAVQALLKRDALKLNEDGSILGLNEQLDAIKKENDYLFADAKEPPRIVAGGNNKPIIGDAVVDAARRAAGLPIATEQK